MYLFRRHCVVAKAETEKLELITSCLGILQKEAAGAAAARCGEVEEAEAEEEDDEEISFRVSKPLKPTDELLSSIDLNAELAS